MEADETIFVVDDDPLIRQSLVTLLERKGYRTSQFGSAEEFLEGYDISKRGCLLLDLQMSGMGGGELQEKLIERRISLPVIVVTGNGTVPTVVNMMTKGAVSLLQKPFQQQELLEM